MEVCTNLTFPLEQIDRLVRLDTYLFVNCSSNSAALWTYLFPPISFSTASKVMIHSNTLLIHSNTLLIQYKLTVTRMVHNFHSKEIDCRYCSLSVMMYKCEPGNGVCIPGFDSQGTCLITISATTHSSN